MRTKIKLYLLLCMPFSLLAADADAPLTVDADSMEADRAREVSVFKGNVQVNKGSIQISADEARLRARAGAVREGTLIGLPVTFRQQPEGEPLIQGEARRIEYDAVNRVIVLTGGAWVRQGRDEFRGESIRYNLDARKVLATSDKSVPERVKIIFQPKSQAGKDEAAAGKN